LSSATVGGDGLDQDERTTDSDESEAMYDRGKLSLCRILGANAVSLTFLGNQPGLLVNFFASTTHRVAKADLITKAWLLVTAEAFLRNCNYFVLIQYRDDRKARSYGTLKHRRS